MFLCYECRDQCVRWPHHKGFEDVLIYLYPEKASRFSTSGPCVISADDDCMVQCVEDMNSMYRQWSMLTRNQEKVIDNLIAQIKKLRGLENRP